MELLAYKEQQMTKPEVKLEAELSLLKVEKVGSFFKFACIHFI